MILKENRLTKVRAEVENIHKEALQSQRVVEYRNRMLDLLDHAGEEALNRNHPQAHFTASAFIFSPRGEVLALFHRKLKRWLQPGGHIESDDQSALNAALREATEESALVNLQLITKVPIDLDIHLIPARLSEPEHEHFDIRFAFMTHTPHRAQLSQESSGLEWLSDESLSQWMSENESIRRPVSLVQSLLTQG